MTLQFNAGDYFRAYQQGQENQQADRDRNQNAVLGGLSGIAGGMQQYKQQQKQDAMNKLMLQMKQDESGRQNMELALKAGEQGYDPNNFMNPQSAAPQAPQSSPSSPPVGPYSNPMGQNTPPATTGGSYATPPSPLIDAWNNHPDRTQFAPSNGPRSMFQKKPVDYGGIMKGMQSGDYSGFQNANPKQQGQIEKMREFDQREADRGEMANNRKLQMSQTIGTKENQQQDKLEQNARQMVANLRGDKSLARTEEQRDAAITAYNRLQEIEKTGQPPNPIDYVDILGQIYKARTGSAPTNEIFQQARQETAKGNLGKWYTYFTGNQAPATTQDITNSLKSMAGSMGAQADRLHEGYMKAHLLKPKGLDDERWQPIIGTNRGISFQEATGYQPGQSSRAQQVGRFKVVAH